jgi:hypothetical protein
LSVKSLEEAAHATHGTHRDQLDAIIETDDLQVFSCPDVDPLSDGKGNYYLVFWRNSYRVHVIDLLIILHLAYRSSWVNILLPKLELSGNTPAAEATCSNSFFSRQAAKIARKYWKNTKGWENKGKTAFTALLFYPEARTH